MRQPLKPSDVVSKKLELLPDEVIDAFNELIAKELDGYASIIKQKDLVSLIQKKMPGLTTDELYRNNCLDVEDVFRKEGWIVIYDKPAYNESYDATFEFRKKVV